MYISLRISTPQTLFCVCGGQDGVARAQHWVFSNRINSRMAYPWTTQIRSQTLINKCHDFIISAKPNIFL